MRQFAGSLRSAELHRLSIEVENGSQAETLRFSSDRPSFAASCSSFSFLAAADPRDAMTEQLPQLVTTRTIANAKLERAWNRRTTYMG